jgi:hypothetical protein
MKAGNTYNGKVVPVIKHYAIMAYGEVGVYTQVFLISALIGGE